MVGFDAVLGAFRGKLSWKRAERGGNSNIQCILWWTLGNSNQTLGLLHIILANCYKLPVLCAFLTHDDAISMFLCTFLQ